MFQIALNNAVTNHSDDLHHHHVSPGKPSGEDIPRVSPVIILIMLKVLISVLCNRALRQPPNLLLLSLAVTDMLVSLLVMPGALMQHTTGYWPGQDWLCLAWVFSDVFLCTSSILSLTAICIGESLHSHFTVTSQCHENNISSNRTQSHYRWE